MATKEVIRGASAEYEIDAHGTKYRFSLAWRQEDVDDGFVTLAIHMGNIQAAYRLDRQALEHAVENRRLSHIHYLADKVCDILFRSAIDRHTAIVVLLATSVLAEHPNDVDGAWQRMQEIQQFLVWQEDKDDLP